MLKVDPSQKSDFGKEINDPSDNSIPVRASEMIM